jgi:hypothetical protein|tara:strand:+ start:83 stop:1093 length:1011 start_codon:yes stop_codon:yes gene_type:complete
MSISSNNILQVYDNTRCCALLKPPNNTRQCSFKPHTNGLCKRHYKLSQNNTSNVKTVLDKKQSAGSDFNNRAIGYYDNPVYYNASVLIQSIVRRYVVKSNIHHRGVGIYCRHNIKNDTDCASFQDIANISIKNMFTYVDQSGLYWGFHVATLKELMKTCSLNPYNMLPINTVVIDRFNRLLKVLEKKTDIAIKQDIITDPNMITQQRCFDIFQRIDELKYYTQCSWFLDLDIIGLKELYKQLEDIWNYRANLSIADKFKYSSTGKLFTQNVIVINQMTSGKEISKILLDNFEKLVTHGKEKEDRITGALWILGALTIVNPCAREALPWLFQSTHID